MSVAIRAITRLQDADDVNVTPAVGVDEYALTYDHGTERFVLRAPAAPFAGILATGATVGATSQAQAFTLGVVSPFSAPAADSTTAWQVRKADGTTPIVTVDTTNGRVGIGTAAPFVQLQLGTTYVNVPDTRLHVGIIGTGAFSNVLTFDFDGNAGIRGVLGGSSDASSYQSLSLGTIGYGGDQSQTLNLRNGNVGIGTTSPATRLDIDAGALTMAEMAAPTGVANKAMLYTKDTGGGKTALCCKLGDDVEIVLATQA